MDNNVIKLSKIAKIIGIVCIVVFLIPTGILLITGNFLGALFFTPFIALGVVLLLAYRKNTIHVGENEIVFNYIIKKTRRIRYEDIDCLLFIPVNNKTQMALIDKRYNRIVSLDTMLTNLQCLFEMLGEKGIKILDFGEMVEKNQDVSRYFNALNFIERNYYSTVDSEHRTVEKISKEEADFDIEKTRKKLKILGWILLLANPAAFFIGGKSILVIPMAILLVSYAVYIRYYPYIYIETVSKKGQERALQMPFIGPSVALLLSITILQIYDYDFGDFMMITAGITAVLAVPFIIKSVRTSVQQKLSRKISVIFAAFMISFCITLPINLLLTFDAAEHETTIITDKDISSGKTRDYYLYGTWNGRKEEFSVSKSEYNDTSIGDQRRICIKRSALGLEYYTIHE